MARIKMQLAFDCKVHLFLFVKVWENDPHSYEITTSLNMNFKDIGIIIISKKPLKENTAIKQFY